MMRQVLIKSVKIQFSVQGAHYFLAAQERVLNIEGQPVTVFKTADNFNLPAIPRLVITFFVRKCALEIIIVCAGNMPKDHVYSTG